MTNIFYPTKLLQGISLTNSLFDNTLQPIATTCVNAYYSYLSGKMNTRSVTIISADSVPNLGLLRVGAMVNPI